MLPAEDIADEGGVQKTGWRENAGAPTLPEVYHSILVPTNASFWRRLLAFAGPGYLVAVGYMDPGNWATDISAGALFNYRLLSVILISNFLAIYLQSLSAKLGIVTGRDLAQACRDAYRKPVVIVLWLSAEIAIVACDIAEVLGAAIALNLLFGIPLAPGVLLTGLDVLLVLALQHRSFRWIEMLVVLLIGVMMAIFGVLVFYAHPDWGALFKGFVPGAPILFNHEMLYISLGILGATVMPHNLYLHSSIIQTRSHGRGLKDMTSAIRCAYADSTVALTLALFVNAAILVVAAAAFYRTGHHEVGQIQDAYKLLSPLLGVSLAAPLFAVALLASGQNSTLTGTLAGQIILEGFIQVKMTPWVRRVISRSLAIVPAVVIVAWYGPRGAGPLLVFSQVILSLQLSFAVIPLIQFTGDSRKMGPFVNGPGTKIVGWIAAIFIAGLNAYLVYSTLIH